jgi:hypothetical protein
MNNNYFTNCNTIDEAKNVFRKLCFEIHPDQRPTEEQAMAHKEFIVLREQYENFKPSEGRERTTADETDIFYNLFKNFDILKNVKVTFIGSWIWLSDEEPNATREQKELIKNIVLDGYRCIWNKTRKIWQFKPLNSNYRKFNNKEHSAESLKSYFGGKEFKTSGKKQTTLS